MAHQAQVTVQIHRLVGLVGQIAVLLSLKDIKFNLKTGRQLRIGVVYFFKELYVGDRRGLSASGEPLGTLFPVGLGRLVEDMFDKPDIGVGLGRGVFCLGFKPLAGQPETI